MSDVSSAPETLFTPLDPPKGIPGQQSIHEVCNVEIVEDDGQLVIHAAGAVTSAGWKEPELLLVNFVKAPDDGIYDFEFRATAPRDPVVQVITSIEVRHVLRTRLTGLRGVRILAATNKMEALLPEHSPAA